MNNSLNIGPFTIVKVNKTLIKMATTDYNGLLSLLNVQ